MESRGERANTAVRRLVVVGAGVMGSQIAALGALGGLDVALQDVDPRALLRAEDELRSRLARHVEKGRLSADERDAALQRLRFTDSLDAAARDADIAIEAASERFGIKAEIFRELDRIAPAHAVLASNSSSIVPSRLAEVTARPAQVCNMHFFNPPLVMQCVEVVAHAGVAASTIATAEAVARIMDRTPVTLSSEIPGFIANRLLAVLFREAISLYEGGYASPEDIDAICRLALRHPMGPFELLDLGGLDVNMHMQTALYEQTGDESFKPQGSILDRVEKGRLGRKSGEGFYRYPAAQEVGA